MLITLNGKTVLIFPDDCKYPYGNGIHIDIVICTHKCWEANKYHIIHNTLVKPKVIYLDKKEKKIKINKE